MAAAAPYKEDLIKRGVLVVTAPIYGGEGPVPLPVWGRAGRGLVGPGPRSAV